jgi:hypothetical protein
MLDMGFEPQIRTVLGQVLVYPLRGVATGFLCFCFCVFDFLYFVSCVLFCVLCVFCLCVVFLCWITEWQW